MRFERVGSKILLVQSNQFFRSSSSDPAERLAVRQSFPESVLASFAIAAQEGTGAESGTVTPTEAGAVLVDATDFFMRDIHDVLGTLTQTKQCVYKLDTTRSSLVLESTHALPKNTRWKFC